MPTEHQNQLEFPDMEMPEASINTSQGTPYLQQLLAEIKQFKESQHQSLKNSPKQKSKSPVLMPGISPHIRVMDVYSKSSAPRINRRFVQTATTNELGRTLTQKRVKQS